MALALVASACSSDGDETVTVSAADYAFQDLPRSVDAGTTFKLTNKSTRELHELVAFRIPDSETRSAADLIKLPEEQLNVLFSGEPALVILAPPNGGEQILAVGDGKLTEKGRYMIACAIPTGADPQAYLAAAQSGEGPPDVPGGPPHFTQGMFAELTVK